MSSNKHKRRNIHDNLVVMILAFANEINVETFRKIALTHLKDNRRYFKNSKLKQMSLTIASTSQDMVTFQIIITARCPRDFSISRLRNNALSGDMVNIVNEIARKITKYPFDYSALHYGSIHRRINGGRQMAENIYTMMLGSDVSYSINGYLFESFTLEYFIRKNPNIMLGFEPSEMRGDAEYRKRLKEIYSDRLEAFLKELVKDPNLLNQMKRPVPTDVWIDPSVPVGDCGSFYPSQYRSTIEGQVFDFSEE